MTSKDEKQLLAKLYKATDYWEIRRLVCQLIAVIKLKKHPHDQ